MDKNMEVQRPVEYIRGQELIQVIERRCRECGAYDRYMVRNGRREETHSMQYFVHNSSCPTSIPSFEYWKNKTFDHPVKDRIIDTYSSEEERVMNQQRNQQRVQELIEKDGSSK